METDKEPAHGSAYFHLYMIGDITNFAQIFYAKDRLFPPFGEQKGNATLSLDDYLENSSILYENGTVEAAASHPITKILTPEGYIDYVTTGKPYCYFKKDNLGSIREVASYLGQSGTIVQIIEYYPSGTPFAQSHGTGVQPYKFTGKEFITMHGLNWQDYGARWLDNVRMQWTSIDPLTEKHPNISPYVYCSDNPINAVDPDGLDPYFFIKPSDKNYSGFLDLYYNLLIKMNRNQLDIIAHGYPGGMVMSISNDRGNYTTYRVEKCSTIKKCFPKNARRHASFIR